MIHWIKDIIGHWREQRIRTRKSRIMRREIYFWIRTIISTVVITIALW